MNAKQAIEILLENQSGARARMLDYATSHPEYANIQLRDCEAFELALEALREKLEREKGCEYCHSRFGIATHHITDSGMKAGTNKNVNFCPMCGKRLEVEP